MLRFPARDFFEVFTVISDLAAQLDSLSIDSKQLIPTEQKESIRPILTRAKGLSVELSLDISLSQIDEILSGLDFDYSVISLRRALMGLKSTILREIELSPRILWISREKVKFLVDEAPFSEGVSRKFNRVNYDISEASRCLAIARYSACVMHLQKVVEVGLQAFAAWAQVSGIVGQLQLKNPNWGAMLEPLRKEFRERTMENSWPDGVDPQFCENVRAFIESVRTAWRNPSMHFGRQYDEKEAEDIYFAVRGFMRFLASHLDEVGNFEASGKLANGEKPLCVK
ncbi:MAG: hypothetical protein WBO10_02735 [Pyrinomonadaceae bacterium]